MLGLIFNAVRIQKRFQHLILLPKSLILLEKMVAFLLNVFHNKSLF